MSKERINRNLEIIKLINEGISYRNISLVLGLFPSRIENINRVYNKDKEKLSYCVRCGNGTNLLLKNKIRNICLDCAEYIKKA